MPSPPLPLPRRKIETNLPYHPFGKYLLVPDDLTQDRNATAVYERGVVVKAHVAGEYRGMPVCHCQREELGIPSIELITHPRTSYKEINRASYDMEAEMKERARDCMARLEDVEILKKLNDVVFSDHSFTIQGCLQPENLIFACALIEKHEMFAEYILLHPMRLKDLRNWGDSVPGLTLYPRSVWCNDPMQVRGEFQEAKILVSTMCPKNCAYVFAPPEFVGVLATIQPLTFVERRDIEVPSLPICAHTLGSEYPGPVSDSGGAPELGVEYVYRKEIAIGVLNDCGIARVQVQ